MIDKKSRQSLKIYSIHISKKIMVKLLKIAHSFNKRFLILPYMDVFLTTRCNLKCRDCFSLIPYYKNSPELEATKIINNIYKVLESVNYLMVLGILGGETLLYKDLDKIINEFRDNKKIMSIIVFSNGMITPNQQLLNTLKHKKITFVLSDYTVNSSKLDEFKQLLKNSGIRYIYEESKVWYPVAKFKKNNYSNMQIKNVFKQCNLSHCTTLYDNKIFTCSRLAHANALGFIPDEDNRPVVLDEYSHKELKKRLGELVFQDYNSGCDYCAMVSQDMRTVKAGIQLKKDEEPRKLADEGHVRSSSKY